MIRPPRKRKPPAPCRDPQIDKLLTYIIQDAASRQRVVELCYWSREPELLEAIRMFAAMTPASQAALTAFLAIAGEGESIAANLDRTGKLTLTSPHVGEALSQVVDAREARIEIAPGPTPRIH